MYKDDWLDKATEKIRFLPDRERVRRELEDHILDRMEASSLAGRKAEEAAVAAMGDPGPLSVELGKIHTPYLGWLWQGSRWLLGLLLAWFLLGVARPELLYSLRLVPSEEWNQYITEYTAAGEHRVVTSENPDGTTYQATITCETLWEDMDLGHLGGYRWRVPLTFIESTAYSGAVPEDVTDSSTLVVYLTASTPFPWEPWQGRDSIISVTDNRGVRYPNSILYNIRSTDVDTYFWGNSYSLSPFSTGADLRLTGVEDPEDIEWLDVEIGDQILRIDLPGGEQP